MDKINFISQKPQKSFIIDPKMYNNLSAKSKVEADMGSLELDKYIKKTLPEGDIVTLSQDTLNGEKKIIVNHFAKDGSGNHSIALSPFEFTKSAFFGDKNPIVTCIDFIAENLKKVRI